MIDKVSLGAIATIRQGRYLSPGKMAPSATPETPTPVWGARGILGYTDQPTYVEPVPLVTCRGNGCGLVQWTKSASYISNNAMAIVPLSTGAEDSRYLYYSLLNGQFGDVTTGSAQPQITISHLSQKLVSWHNDPVERGRIACILGALDDKIELNRKMSAALEAMARALFKSWFVDFDPVRAKAEGRDPGMPADLAALFPDSFWDSEIGEAPMGWTVRALPEVVQLNPRLSLKGVAEAPYLDMANVPTSGYAVERVISRAVSSGSRFQNGDTLLARITPCLENGKTAFVDFLNDGQVGWGSTEFIVLRPRAPLPAEYGYLLARSDGFRSFAIAKMTGSSGRQRVPVDALASFLVALPPAAISEAFTSIIQPMFRRISAAGRESRVLAEVRDALLPRLISGEIRLTDAEDIVEKPA